MIEKNDIEKWTDECPVYRLFDLLGKKWVIFVIILIGEGFKNFSSLQKKLSKINSKILSERLDLLVKEAYIERIVSTKKPLRITYILTPKGEMLSSKIQDLGTWVKEKENLVLYDK